MSIDSILTFLQNSALAHSISKSNHLVGAGLQVVHILSFMLLLASLVLVSLRVLGVAFVRETLPQIGKEAARLLWPSLVLTLASGALMFIATPKLYFDNPAFELKMLLLLAAAIVHVALFSRIARKEAPAPGVARATVGVSLATWFGVALAGRMIGFI